MCEGVKGVGDPSNITKDAGVEFNEEQNVQLKKKKKQKITRLTFISS